MALKGEISKNAKTGAALVGNKRNGYVFPPIFFTTDPSLRKIEENILRGYGIQSWQIVYTPTVFDYKGTDGVEKIPNYLGENKEMVIHGFMLWKQQCPTEFTPELMTVFTDNGEAFKAKDSSLLKILGVKNHVYLVSVGHHLLSTCDNGTNAKAKRDWREAAATKNSPVYPYAGIRAFVNGCKPKVQTGVYYFLLDPKLSIGR